MQYNFKDASHKKYSMKFLRFVKTAGGGIIKSYTSTNSEDESSSNEKFLASHIADLLYS